MRSDTTPSSVERHAADRRARNGVTAALLAGAAILLAACGGQRTETAIAPDCRTRAYPEIGGPFSLVRNDGVRVTEADFKGSRTLVFFGFTHCPDVCPNTLYAIGAALDQLPEGTEPPVTALISVDPERDTPEAMSAYVASAGFPAKTVGLTGTEEELRAASRAFAAAFQRVDDPASRVGYLVDHSALIYLMDENWSLQTFFTPDTRPSAMAACIAALG
ncbi:SCO family protein [bacterium]|nr:SCO family protein [bacterium]